MCFGLCEYDDERYSPPRRSNYPGYNYSGPNNCNYNYGYDNVRHRNGRRHHGLFATMPAEVGGSAAGCGGGGGGCGGGGGG
ncbi:hypothetical protein KXW11_006038, partial [Aspergillus fumigatus]